MFQEEQLTWTNVGRDSRLESMLVFDSALEAHGRRLALDSLQG
jgi:hypothetical protein